MQLAIIVLQQEAILILLLVSDVPQIIQWLVVMQKVVLIIVFELVHILLAPWQTLLFGEVNEVGAAISDEDVADLGLLLLVVVVHADARGLSQVRDLTLHLLVLLRHHLHLVVEELVLVREVLQKV